MAKLRRPPITGHLLGLGFYCALFTATLALAHAQTTAQVITRCGDYVLTGRAQCPRAGGRCVFVLYPGTDAETAIELQSGPHRATLRTLDGHHVRLRVRVGSVQGNPIATVIASPRPGFLTGTSADALLLAERTCPEAER